MAKTVLLRTLISPAPLIRCGNNTLPVLSMTMHEGIVLQSNRFKKNLASLDQSNYKVVQRGQLVVGFPIDEGVLYIQSIVDFGIMSPAYNVWNVDVDKVSSRFLELSLHSPMAMQYYKDNLRGTTARRRSIPSEVLLALPLVLPPMEEQQRIVSALDKLTHLIALRKQQLAKLDELVKARFVEMFGEPVRNECDWKQIVLGDLCDVGSSKRIFEKEYVSEGIPFYRTKEIVELSKGNKISTELFISESRFEEIKQFYGVPQKNDLLISAVGTIGTIWIVDGEQDFYFKDGNLLRISSSSKFDSIYMKYLLENLIDRYKQKMSAGTAYAALTIVALKNMLVYDVPLSLQKIFSGFVEQTSRQRLTIQQSLDKMEVLKKSLMQEYFG